MSDAKRDIGFSCQGASNGTVRLAFTEGSSPTAQIDMPANAIGQIAGSLLAAAKQASRMANQKPNAAELDAGLHGQSALIPTGIRLTSAPQAPHCLVIEVGSAQLAIALPEKWLTALGHALLAASAQEGQPQ